MNQVALRVGSLIKSEAYVSRALEFFGQDKEKLTKFQSVLITIAQNKSLESCTAESIISSAFSLAELNLDINPLLNQCYVLSYAKGGQKEAQPAISYKGWQTILKRSGRDCKAYSVFNCDEFFMDLSDFEEKITFKPNFKERKESNDEWYKKNLLGIVVKIYSSDFKKIVFVSRDKIEKIKGKSPAVNSQYSPYNNWAEEMYLAKAIKYVLSREPLGVGDEIISKGIALENSTEILNKEAAKTEKQAETIQNELESIIDTEVIAEAQNETDFNE